MSSINSIIDAALARAHGALSEGAEKQASASGGESLADQARQSAQALEYLATKIADDGSREGAHRREILESFFADKSAAAGSPKSSPAPTGKQSMPPQSGKTTITPSKGGNVESEAPTGKQTTIGQDPPATQTPPQDPPGKYASSLYDLLTKSAAKGGPADSHALDDQAAPPKKNENSNISLIAGGNDAPVRATKRQAKAPTRARLKQLFAGASDTGPANAAAKAAFPQAYAKGGGIKEAAKGDARHAASDYRTGSKLVRQSTKARGMSMPDRERMRTKGLTMRADALEKGRGLDTMYGGVLGGVGGANLGTILGHRYGGRRGSLIGGALGVAGGAAAGALGTREFNKSLERKARQEVGDKDIMRARMSEKLNRPGRLRQEARLQARQAAARRGEKASSPTISIKKGSIADYAELFDAVLEGHAGEEVQKIAQAVAELGD